MSAFHLLRLPLVAMEHVLYMLNPYELLNISLTSTKSKKAVKALSKIKQDFSASIEIYHAPFISISRKHEKWNFRWVSKESIAGYKVDTHRANVSYFIDKYSKNPIVELMICYDYITEVLGCQLHDVRFNLSSYPSHNKLIAYWLHSHPMTHIEISSFKETDDDLEYVIKNITVIDSLTLTNVHYNEDFQMEIPTTPYEILIDDSSFINFEQLLRLENSRIFLYQSFLTDEEINKFLKSWMACESHLELEAFSINVSDLETMDAIMNLPYEKIVDPNVIRTFEEEFYNAHIEVGFNIKRCDGKMATVGYGYSFYEPHFFMLIR